MRHTRGVTLIELMVGIAIMAMVMLASVSLGGGWINEARVTDARSQMRLAYSKARAYALRNDNARPVNAVAAWMCVANAVVYVYESTTANPTGPTACGDAGSVWHADLAGGTSTTVEVAAAANSTAFSCLGFSNRGLPLASASIGVTTCTTSQTIYVKRGDANEETTLI